MAKKRKFPIFVITLVIGIGFIAVAFLQPEFIFGDTSQPFDLSSFVGLTIIEVPIDPTGGQILGTVKFGAPIVVPFERSGTILSADFIGNCIKLQEGETPSPTAFYEVPFGRIGSGDRNAEVSWHGYNGINCGFGYLEFDLADLPNDFVATGIKFQLNLKSVQGRGSLTNNPITCTVIYLSNTIDEIGERRLPNRIMWGSNTGGMSSATLATKYIPSSSGLFFGSTDFVAWGGSKYTPAISGSLGTGAPSTGQWCRTIGVKSFTFGQISPDGTFSTKKGVDTFNELVSGGAFPQGTRSDKFTLGFFVNGVGANKFVIDHQWWEENGSLLVTGSSQPIKCGVGFTQVDFRCIPIVCDITETLNLTTNECEPIVCDDGLVLEIKDVFIVCTTGIPPQCNSEQIAVCTKINPCSNTEIFVDGICQPISIFISECPDGTQIVGSDCEPLFCGEGFEINGNQCTLKTCGIGTELRGDSCQSIICPINTRLIGNDCIEISCPTGQVAIDNVCQDPPILDPVECEADMFGELLDPTCIPADGGVDPTMLDCDTGFKQVGDSCVPIDLNCPEGTEEFENNCRNIFPSLLQVSGIDPTLFLIIGIVITGMSGVGIVARRR